MKIFNYAKKIITTTGADKKNSERLAEALVSTNLAGVDTHGIWHLPGYVDLIRSGEIILQHGRKLQRKRVVLLLLKEILPLAMPPPKLQWKLQQKKL